MAHGITATETSAGARAIVTVSTAVIGMVCTGPDADGQVFPLDRVVLVDDLAGAIAQAGATGTLKSALQAIADQTDAPVLVVRVATHPDPVHQDALVVGDIVNDVATGMQALLRAEAALGLRPRILGCPGLDSATVTAALAVLARKLRGFVYARAIGASPAEALAYAASFGARELMPIYDDFTIAGLTAFATARALGLRARLDQEQGWHRSLSNVVVNGVSGIARPVHFDIMDPACEAGLLNDGNVTALVNHQGFRFWGNRTTSADPLFAFEVATRTAQVLIDTIADGLTWAIDKPLTPGLVKDIVETVNAKLRELVAQGRLLGGKCWFDKAKNDAATLAGGKLVIDYDFTPVPPLEALGLIQHITDSYAASLFGTVGSSAGGSAGSDAGGGDAPPLLGTLDFSNPANSGLI